MFTVSIQSHYKSAHIKQMDLVMVVMAADCLILYVFVSLSLVYIFLSWNTACCDVLLAGQKCVVVVLLSGELKDRKKKKLFIEQLLFVSIEMAKYNCTYQMNGRCFVAAA